MPAVSLDSLIANKLWDRTKARLEESIANGTFNKQDLKKALNAGAELSGIDLSQIKPGALDDLVLEGGSLAKAKLPSMQSVVLKNVDLKGAQVYNSELKSVRFEDCNLDLLRMQNSKMQDVAFTGASSMNEADIFTSKATNVSFALNSMVGCKLFDSTFENVSFTNQKMLGTSIVSVHLQSCDLRGADLRACDVVLGSVDDKCQFKGAVVTGRERLRDGLNLKELGAVIGPTTGLRDKLPEEAWRNFSARAGNSIPFYRNEIAKLEKELFAAGDTQLKLDGSGRHVIQIEQVPDSTVGGPLPPFSHANAVRSRILAPGESGGLACGVKHTLIDLSPESVMLQFPSDRAGNLVIVQDTKEHLDTVISRYASTLPRLTAQRLKEVADQQENSDTKADAIVIAMGVSRAKIYADVFQAIDPKTHPRIADTIFGKDSTTLSLIQKQQALITYVERIFDEDISPEVHSSFTELDKQVDRLWEQNTLVVLSAGNDSIILKQFEGETQSGVLTYEYPAELNILARGKVLTVGASDSAATAESIRDDTPAPFSSRGDGQGHPAISAGGQSVLIGYEIQDGTSFSAPFAASVITLMRQIKPELSAKEVMHIITESSYDNPKIDASLEGAGQLDVISALRQAAKQKKGIGLAADESP